MKIYKCNLYFLFVFFALYIPPNSFAQNPSLIKDVNNYALGLNPGYFGVEMNGVMYFIAKNKAYGSELWRTDGTENGTYMVKDIFPGPDGGAFGELIVVDGELFFQGNNGEVIGLWSSDGTEQGTQSSVNILPDQILGALGELIFFTYYDSLHGSEMWCTDGTASGTFLIKDINSGSGSSCNLTHACIAGGYLYFSANDGIHGTELWRTNGIADSTSLVRDIWPGVNSSIAYQHQIVEFNGEVYFSANEGVHGEEFWKSNGTYTGTQMVMDIRQGNYGSSPEIFVFEDYILLSAYASLIGTEPYISDGTTSGTSLLKDISLESSNPKKFTSVNSNFFFIADSELGEELWVTDGTEQGTHVVKDLCAGVNGTDFLFLSAVNDQLFFVANSILFYDYYQFGFSDGTEAGTSTYQFNPAMTESAFALVGKAGNKIIFFGGDSNEVQTLWSSDGTFQGTHQIYYESKSAYSNARSYEYLGNGKHVFLAFSNGYGNEPWVTDGTADGTHILKDIYPGMASSSGNNFIYSTEKYFEVSNGIAFFVSELAGSPDKLWRTDGTEDGTFQLTPASTSNDDTYHVGTVNGRVLFVREIGSDQLWSTDGTIAGTFQLSLPVPPQPNNSFGNQYCVVDSFFYFTEDEKLYKTNGTPSGSFLVKSFAGGNIKLPLVPFNGYVYFSSNLSGSVYKLWRSDGTAAGTQVFKDINIVNGATPYVFMEANGLLYFISSSSLWRTDGTDLGTVLVKGLNNAYGGGVSEYGSVNGYMYFYEDFALPGETYLWISDGTETGTIFISNFRQINGNCYSNYHASYFIPAEDRMFFLAKDSMDELSYWVSDGTVSGTHWVKNIGPAGDPFSFTHVAVIDTFLLFWANDELYGEELWITDGTECFTQIVKDFNEGEVGSNYEFGIGMLSDKDTLLFTVRHDDYGTEPWKYILPEINGTEIINGLDDNCNGMVDEFPVSDFNQVQESSLILFPNPSSDYFEIKTLNIRSKIVSITIFNLLGVPSTNCYINSLNDEVSVRHSLLPGNYFVKLTTEDSIIVAPLIVQTN